MSRSILIFAFSLWFAFAAIPAPSALASTKLASGQQVYTKDGLPGTIAGVFPNGFVSVKVGPGDYRKLNRDEVAVASGCSGSYCVGKSVVTSDGDPGKILGILPNGTMVVAIGPNLNYPFSKNDLAIVTDAPSAPVAAQPAAVQATQPAAVQANPNAGPSPTLVAVLHSRWLTSREFRHQENSLESNLESRFNDQYAFKTEYKGVKGSFTSQFEGTDGKYVLPLRGKAAIVGEDIVASIWNIVPPFCFASTSFADPNKHKIYKQRANLDVYFQPSTQVGEYVTDAASKAVSTGAQETMTQSSNASGGVLQ